MPITENSVIKTGVALATGTAVGTNEITSRMGMFQDADELKFVLWVVGGLLGVISTLLAIVAYFIKDMRASDKKHHAILYEKTEKNEEANKQTAEVLAGLMGQHTAAFQARGCAYDADRLQSMINAAVTNSMKARRASDCNHCASNLGNDPQHGE